MTENIESRLTELEIKVSFQEDLINALNEIIVQQQNSLDGLQRQLKLLHQNVAQKDDLVIEKIDEKPPHY